MRDASETGNYRSELTYALMLVGMFAVAYYLPLPQSSLLTPPLETSDLPEPEIITEIPDFSAIVDVEEKKQAFFDFLQPYVDAQNAKVLQQRERLLALTDKVNGRQELDRNERLFIRNLADQYEMASDNYRDRGFLNRLLRRVDVLPPSLVLAQAANESAWGTSRFALEAYNFFGQWCYSEGCGMVPNRRRPSARHELKSFNSLEDAVDAYFRNLNTFPSYQDLRLIRESLRASDRPIDGISLARGLMSYSERGEAYIGELQSMIEFNALLERDMQLIPGQLPSRLD